MGFPLDIIMAGTQSMRTCSNKDENPLLRKSRKLLKPYSKKKLTNLKELNFNVSFGRLPILLTQQGIIYESLCFQMIDDILQGNGHKVLTYLMRRKGGDLIYPTVTNNLNEKDMIRINFPAKAAGRYGKVKEIKPQYKSIW